MIQQNDDLEKICFRRNISVSVSKSKYSRKNYETAIEKGKTGSSFRSSLKSSYIGNKIQTQPVLMCNYSEIDDSLSLIYEKYSNERKQIASLTKIMTVIVTIQEIQKFGLEPQNQIYTVSKEAASIGGTTAYLQTEDLISLWDLLYGLMLPSGNDAAMCIAENIGQRFLKEKKIVEKHSENEKFRYRISSKKIKSTSSYYKGKDKSAKHQTISCFVDKMNKLAKSLGMNDTYYINPHGLQDQKSYSTVWDQAILVRYCIKNQMFKKIVKTKLYFGSVEQTNSGWTRQMLWENTNKLLSNGFQGIKTGNTSQAKYCLASWYQIPSQLQNKKHVSLIIIVLGCQSKEERDNKTINIAKMGLKLLKSSKIQDSQE